MLDYSKSVRQEKGIQIWKDNKGQGTLHYIPRFGKTRVIELVIEKTRYKHPIEKIIVCVPTDIALQNVKRICKKHEVEVYTINVLNNMINNGLKIESYLLIVDEIHKFITDKSLSVLTKLSNNTKFRLGLTGSTLTLKDKQNLSQVGFPIIDTITEKEAIDNNWIVTYDQYNVAIDISTEQEKIRYKNLSDNIDKIADRFKTVHQKVNNALGRLVFISDFEVIQACYIGKRVMQGNMFIEFIKPDTLRKLVAHIMGYRKDAEIVNDYTKTTQTIWNPNNIEELAKSYNKAVLARNEYLKHNIDKINAVLQLTKFIKKPAIIYNDSIPMIDQLHDCIKSSVKYHSGIESCTLNDSNGNVICYTSGERKGQPKMFGATTLKKLAIETIKNNEVQYLITGRSLNESLNLPNIEYIICTSGDTNNKTYEQRVSRGKTINMKDSTKHCIIINLFLNDFYLNNDYIRSRDKEKLIIRQENVKNPIWIENIDDFISLIKNNY